jgi:apolipoprotein N-acyltransferase
MPAPHFAWMCAASILAGEIHGQALGSPVAALLQLSGGTLLGGVLFLLRARQRWSLLFVCLAAFSFTSTGVGLRWMASAIMAPHVFGFALGSLIYGLLIVGMSGLNVLCLWLTAVASARLSSAALCCALFSSALLVGDALREALLPSFPWLSVGYAQLDSPFAALMPLLGLRGTSWMVMFAEFLLGALGASTLGPSNRGARASRLPLVICALLVATALALASRWTAAFTHEAGPLRVALMQTAVSIKEKFRASLLARHLTDIGEFAQSHDAQLIVTPETAVPTTLRALTPAQEHYLERSVSPTRALLFGAFAEDSQGAIFNSAVMLQDSGAAPTAIQRTVYIKQHLAPLGEYAPPGFRWLAELLNLPLSNLRSTADAPRNFRVFGVTVIPSVCEDLLYGDDLRTTSSEPHVLVNLSNVAFFVEPLARNQFLNIARARALEQQVPVLIAANFGPTAFIDAQGRIQRQLPAATSGALEITLQLTQGATPYARFGDAFTVGLVILTGVYALAAWIAAFSKARQGSPV